MSISTTELIIIFVFFIVLSLMRHHRAPKSVDDIAALRAIIRSERAHLDAAAQQRMFEELANAANKEKVRERLTDWNSGN